MIHLPPPEEHFQGREQSREMEHLPDRPKSEPREGLTPGVIFIGHPLKICYPKGISKITHPWWADETSRLLFVRR